MVVEKQLLPTVADDGRIHTTFKQMVAATGRLSSDNPNLQNVPIRTQQGREIRQGFVPGPGYEALLTADYSQIEMRIMAHLSGDDGLIEAFRSGEDLHRFVGSRVFGVPPGQVTPEMRAKIKAMSYGLAYGLSAFGLSRQLTIPVEEATALGLPVTAGLPKIIYALMDLYPQPQNNRPTVQYIPLPYESRPMMPPEKKI